MISKVLSDFPSQFHFQFHPLFFKQTKKKGNLIVANVHVHCSTDQNSLDNNFFQEAS